MNELLHIKNKKLFKYLFKKKTSREQQKKMGSLNKKKIKSYKIIFFLSMLMKIERINILNY